MYVPQALISQKQAILFETGCGADVTRIYRYLNEVNYNGKNGCFLFAYLKNGMESKIKAGAFSTIKERFWDLQLHNQSQ